MVQQALKHAQGDRVEIDDIYSSLLLGQQALMVIVKGDEIVGVLGYELQKNPANKVLFLNFLAGGGFDQWVDQLEKVLIQYKEKLGYDCIESSSRAGMMKKLKKRGWKVKAYIMEAPDG